MLRSADEVLRAALAALLAPLALAPLAAAQVRLPAILGDRAVLQAGREVALWGSAEPNETVEISASWGKAASARADASGRWKTTIATPAAGGPFEIAYRTRGGERIVRDVLAGEVWIGSGQSNMEWTVDGAQNAAAELADANYPKIRLFHVDNVPAAAPREDCEGRWAECTPESVHGFSAVAFFFGRKIHKALGVPVGLVESAWGGTRVEAWMDAEALRPLADESRDFALLAKLAADPSAERKEESEELRAWRRDLDRAAPRPAADAAGWKPVTLPAPFESIGLERFDGIVWFRRRVEFPASWAGRELELSLGAIDDNDTTDLDGVEVGRTDGPPGASWNRPRVYTLPAAPAVAGTHEILVRVHDTGGGGGFIGKAAELALGPRGARDLSLAGPWEFLAGPAEDALPKAPERPGIGPNTATALFHGMVAPIAPFGIRGVLWYQGEANTGNARAYAALFPALIRNWRAAFGQGELPFYWVQIAPYRYGPPGDLAAAVRESQRRSLAVPGTGMVVTTDIGNVRDIHPRNKQEVGRRLALWALAKTYGKSDVVPSGPLFAGARFEGGAARVSFRYAEGGLVSRGGPPSHFELAGADGKFVPAVAAIEGETVVARADAVREPAAVRFGWSDVAEPNLFNAAGLPASPFTSESW